MEVFLLVLRLALAGVFGVAGIAKLFDPAGSEKAFADFDNHYLQEASESLHRHHHLIILLTRAQ